MTPPVPARKSKQPPTDSRYTLKDLESRKAADLITVAKEFEIPGASGKRKQDLVFEILKCQAERDGNIFLEGVLERMPEGYGFLRSPAYSYLPGPEDVYVSPSQIRRFGLRIGDYVEGEIRPPKEKERFFAMLKVESINGEPPELKQGKVPFENLTPYFPTQRLMMECGKEEISITGLEHCPFGGTGDGVDDLQAETAHWQLRELAVCLTTPAHRDGAHQPGTTSRPGRNCVEAGAAELQSIVLVNRNRW